MSVEAEWIYLYIDGGKKSNAVLELSGMLSKILGSGTYKTLAGEIIDKYRVKGSLYYSQDTIIEHGFLLWDREQHVNGGYKP